MLKITTLTAHTEPQKPKAMPEPSLAEKLQGFIDKFEQCDEFPAAVVNIKQHPPRKKIYTRTVHNELEEVPQKNTKGQTRFHTAALLGERKWMRLLCETAKDEDLLQADIYGNTPLHYAATRKLLNELVRRRPAIISLLEIPDEAGNTPLHCMAQVREFDCSFLRIISPAELNKLLQLKNAQEQSVWQIIENNGDARLLSRLLRLCAKN